MVSKLLLSRKPSAHRAQPEQLFSTVITTGMSAPPMAAVRVRPYKEKEKRGQKEKKGWRSKVTVMTSEQNTTVTRFHHLNKKEVHQKKNHKPEVRALYTWFLFINQVCSFTHWVMMQIGNAIQIMPEQHISHRFGCNGLQLRHEVFVKTQYSFPPSMISFLYYQTMCFPQGTGLNKASYHTSCKKYVQTSKKTET